jgi:hypothetical protein
VAYRTGQDAAKRLKVRYRTLTGTLARLDETSEKAPDRVWAASGALIAPA